MSYAQNLDNVIQQLKTNPSSGLTDSEVLVRKNKYGYNKLKEEKKISTVQRFISQFKDVMIIILIIASITSFITTFQENNPEKFFEPILILIIVIANAIIGTVQENKAEKSLAALSKLSAPQARVIRNGKESLIKSIDLVPGDIIKLESGDFVPADARLISSNDLKSEESMLTGESIASEKNFKDIVKENAPIGDRSNMVFSGCSITCGTATAVVTSIGMNTEVGKIAKLLNDNPNTQTPLQNKLAGLGKRLGIIALVCCAIIFFIGLIYGIPVMEIFMTSVSLAVSAIPEGLPAIVTIVLSIGVQRMVKKNAIIRRLPAVETLGNTSIICSDKTGTLTQNQMTLVKVYTDYENHVESINDKKNSSQVCNLLKLGTLCSNGSINFESDREQHIGDPTETSIIMAAHKNGFSKESLNQQYPRLREIPFDSDRKLMSTINKINGKNILIVKGAFDILISKCTSGNIESAKKINNLMSSQALRVLAIASKEIETIPEDLKSENLENNLTFLGLFGMIDPPRPEAKKSVSMCISSGIKPIMITGDHVVTASAIASKLGILQDGDIAITGSELDLMNDAELDSKIDKISVYARVSPENKIRIVKAWQRKGKVVAMTGDGVNDSPALKAADIGCAMGITGTDVAKGASDIILTDDNFSTIVDAIKEGRRIYANIKKVVEFLLGTNIGELLSVFFSMLILKHSPLLSMQLLWINLVTDSMPAMALGMEKIESDAMKQKPRPKNEGIFANGLGLRIVLQGIVFSIITIIAFVFGKSSYQNSIPAGQTMAFLVLALSQIVQAFNVRSKKSLFKIGPFTNKKLNFAALFSITLIAIVLFTPLSSLFGFVFLSPQLYAIGVALSFVPLAVSECFKL